MPLSLRALYARSPNKFISMCIEIVINIFALRAMGFCVLVAFRVDFAVTLCFPLFRSAKLALATIPNPSASDRLSRSGVGDQCSSALLRCDRSVASFCGTSHERRRGIEKKKQVLWIGPLVPWLTINLTNLLQKLIKNECDNIINPHGRIILPVLSSLLIKNSILFSTGVWFVVAWIWMRAIVHPSIRFFLHLHWP